MIRWGDPRFVPWLWAVVPLAALLCLLVWRRERRLRRLFADEALARLAPDRWRPLQWIRAALWLAAVLLAVVALARPQWGIRWQEERRRGLDVIVALDTSRSMLAADVRPNRMQRAKWGLSDLLQRLGGDRIGLVAFAGSSFLACPLTADYAAFSMVLEDLRPGSIPRGGTAIAGALETALASFERGGAADRVVIIVTDGEDHEGGVEAAAAALAREKIKVFAVGVGTPLGDFVPAAEGGGHFRDRSGAVVRSAMRAEGLRRIAEATGGAFVAAADEDVRWERILDRGLAGLKREERATKLVQVREERFPWFLGASVFLLSLEALLGERRRPRGGGVS